MEFKQQRLGFFCIRFILLFGVIVVYQLVCYQNRWNIRPPINENRPEHTQDTHAIKRVISNDTVSMKVSCNDTRLMPAGTFPPIALASFPGSGNTWVRHLLETATGYATGSVYNSNILAKKGFIGEKIEAMSGKALTIKTHMFKNHMVGAVLLVRNPYRAIMAEFNRQKAGKTGMAQENSFKTPEWHNFVKKNAGWWINLNQDYISQCHHPGNHTCKSILVVYYEQLKVQPMEELRRIFKYLSLNVDEDRLACVLANADGAFHRPKRNQTFDPFLEEDRRMVDDNLQTYCNMIKKEGLETPPVSFTTYPGTF